MSVKDVLLIEDNIVNQNIFAKLNSDGKYDLTIADSVKTSKEFLNNKKFDVIVIDYLLSDGTAFDILEMNIDIPVIFTTDVGDEETAVRAMKAGVYDYIIKDIDCNYIKLLPLVIENAIKTKEDKENLEKFKKFTEEKIITERDRAQSYLDIAGVIIIMIDRKLNVSMVNKKFCEVMGYKKSEVIGRNWFETFVDGSLKVDFQKKFKECMNKKLSVCDYLEYPIKTKHGNEKIIAWHNTAVKDRHGNIKGILCSGEDITTRIEIDNMKSEFVNTVSHEIRTPLTVISGICQLLLSKTDLNSDSIKSYLNIMYSETNRLNDLVNDYLDIQRIENGRQVLKKEKVSILDVVDETIEMYCSSNEAHKIIMDVSNLSNTYLMGDYNKLKQLLTNLISNAIKYSPNGKEIIIKITETDESILVSIIDHGIGIEKEHIPKLFTKFYRVDLSEFRKVKGTGLGLAICKEIVLAHDGEIDVRSEVGVGSEFYFKIPKYKE